MHMRRIISTAIAPLLVVFAFALTPATGANAQPSCTGTTFFGGLQIPTIGDNTRADNCLLGLGNDSSAVGALQIALNLCYHAGLSIDNDFGPATRSALQTAQRREGVSPDGVYGPATRDHLHWPDQFNGGCHRL